MNRREFCIASGAAALSAGLSRVALAQANWLEKPIRLVVPYTPGGGTDTLARLVGEKVGTAAKWTFVIDNKPGGGGNIGLDAVAKSPPDGYTIGMGQASNLAINPTLYKKMPYDSLKDLVPIVLVASQPVVLAVKGDAPYKSLADLISAAKTKPGEITMASPGSGTIGHLSGEMLARSAGVKILHVPYKGAGPAMTDLLGGQVVFSFLTIPSIVSMLKAGRLRALAVSSAKRNKALPDVPTIAESGFKGFETESWYGLVAPARTPASVVMAINAEVNRMLGRPDVIDKLAAEGNDPLGGSAEKFAAFLKSEHAKWGAVVKDAGVTVD